MLGSLCAFRYGKQYLDQPSLRGFVRLRDGPFDIRKKSVFRHMPFKFLIFDFILQISGFVAAGFQGTFPKSSQLHSMPPELVLLIAALWTTRLCPLPSFSCSNAASNSASDDRPFRIAESPTFDAKLEQRRKMICTLVPVPCSTPKSYSQCFKSRLRCR